MPRASARKFLLRAQESLPEPVRDAYSIADPLDHSPIGIGAIVDAIRSLDATYVGLVLDTLYEIGTPLAAAAVRSMVEQSEFDRLYFWRYVKSIFKRSQLRHDAVTFG